MLLVISFRILFFNVIVPKIRIQLINEPSKEYAEWSKIKPIDIEELELAIGSTDDLSFDNLTSVLFNSCQHFNYET